MRIILLAKVHIMIILTTLHLKVDILGKSQRLGSRGQAFLELSKAITRSIDEMWSSTCVDPGIRWKHIHGAVAASPSSPR